MQLVRSSTDHTMKGVLMGPFLKQLWGGDRMGEQTRSVKCYKHEDPRYLTLKKKKKKIQEQQ